MVIIHEGVRGAGELTRNRGAMVLAMGLELLQLLAERMSK